MDQHKLSELYKTQQSLTEWMADISHADVEAMRVEDNEKRERLRTLQDVLGLPFDAPTKFEASDLRNETPKLKKYLKKHGDELCALRLIPKVQNLPKLRMRGRTAREAHKWFLEQDIDVAQYRADYMPHTKTSNWATIFVVNKRGIHGEIIRGGHHQLTQGFFDSAERPIPFEFSFADTKLNLSRPNAEAKEHLSKIIAHIHVADREKQDALKKQLNAQFAHDYLVGYFETVDSDEFGLWFVDYNRILGDLLKDMKPQATLSKQASKTTSVTGQTGSSGRAEGVVVVVDDVSKLQEVPENTVLVCPVTTPDYVPLMKDAVAIITDQGGILSHAAIVARELHKPCVVGTTDATKVLKTGQRVEVDADKGTVIPIAEG